MSVYVILESGTTSIKIGFTDLPVAKRLKELQTGNPSELQILAEQRDGGRDLEKYLHEKFKDCHIIREWFKLEKDSELVKYINDISDYYIDIDEVNDKVLIYNKMKNWHVDLEG